jgi:hypothetical protein
VDLEIARRLNGTFSPGQSGNPKGGAAHAIARRRIGKAIDKRIKVACAEEIAEGLVAGMLDPDGLPVAARIAFDRVWPTKTALELSGPAGGPLEILSVDERSRLASLLGEEIPEGTFLAAEDPDGSTAPGAA